MKLRETLAKLDRLQQTRGFKITATIVVAAIALTAAIGYAVLVTGPAKDALDERYSFLEDFDEDGRPRPEVDLDAETSSEFDQEQATGEEELELEAFESARQSAVVEAQRITAGLLRARLNPWNVFIAAGAVGAVFIAAIWLGLGLTYVGVNLALAIVVTPLALFSATQGVAVLIGGAGQLALAFATLLRVAAISLGGSTPVTAVARTVLTEAVRMKLSGVFIVLLVFGLAGLPALLDPQEELRYRVQSFLQYAMGGTYVLVAMLTLFFSVATVAFEQRDKIIWQTMTKPVGAWQYVLGKWLGIVTLNACLLGVCGAGIFMFTEYLRAQPAIGERVAYDSGAAGPISEDRLILETRVLTARRVVGATPPVLPDDPEFLNAAQEQIEQLRAADPSFADTPSELNFALSQLYEDVRRRNRTVPPGQGRTFIFEGLGEAIGEQGVITFRFAIDAGTNRPDYTYKVTFVFDNQPPVVRETALGFGQFITVGPWAVNDETGEMAVQVYNADIFTGETNPSTISFPDDGLEVSFPVGGFRANFLRVVTVLWIKLGFLAMVGIFTGTFLSFPVAGLVTAVTAAAAEGAAFIADGVDKFATRNREGETLWFNTGIARIADLVSDAFLPYATMKPMDRLVEGLALPWNEAFAGSGVVLVWIGVLFGAAVFAMRRRELAIYSGH